MSQLIGGPIKGSFAEQDSEDKIDTDGRILERIQKVHGQWIMLVTDWDAVVDFHGLPDTLRRKKEDDEKPLLWLPQDFMEKQQELEKWERVYRVEGIGDKAFDEDEEPNCKVGDLVLAKGTVTKSFSNPTLWFVTKHNIAATIDPNIGSILTK